MNEGVRLGITVAALLLRGAASLRRQAAQMELNAKLIIQADGDPAKLKGLRTDALIDVDNAIDKMEKDLLGE